MSLIAIAWRAHPEYPFIMIMNRDEAHDRPTTPAAWHEADGLRWVGGQDGVAGGTWFGATEQGRYAAVTSWRGVGDAPAGSLSRGKLPLDFLASDAEPVQHARGFMRAKPDCNPFNLVVGTTRDVFYAGSRSKLPLALTPGIHTISNGLLDEHWPKNDWLNNAFGAYVRDSGGYRMLLDCFTGMAFATEGRDLGLKVAPNATAEELADGCFALLSDTTIYAEGLPNTGISREEEERLSAVFVLGEQHGTRASTVLVLSREGDSWFEERSFDASGAETGRAVHKFALPAGAFAGGED
ncbi:NRDE family protein [Derxia lacustris]|uniref:NRDE family protein n=1 Tax=Derxia lacustris TaxID=764842 RepID=UPI000A173C33|nr:NRDE family protein [Derxia lacustris]